MGSTPWHPTPPPTSASSTAASAAPRPQARGRRAGRAGHGGQPRRCRHGRDPGDAPQGGGAGGRAHPRGAPPDRQPVPPGSLRRGPAAPRPPLGREGRGRRGQGLPRHLHQQGCGEDPHPPRGPQEAARPPPAPALAARRGRRRGHGQAGAAPVRQAVHPAARSAGPRPGIQAQRLAVTPAAGVGRGRALRVADPAGRSREADPPGARWPALLLGRPPPDTGHPGNDPLCRCVARPIFPKPPKGD